MSRSGRWRFLAQLRRGAALHFHDATGYGLALPLQSVALVAEPSGDLCGKEVVVGGNLASSWGGKEGD